MRRLYMTKSSQPKFLVGEELCQQDVDFTESEGDNVLKAKLKKMRAEERKKQDVQWKDVKLIYN
jgi:hypothetical protein